MEIYIEEVIYPLGDSFDKTRTYGDKKKHHLTEIKEFNPNSNEHRVAANDEMSPIIPPPTTQHPTITLNISVA